MWVLLLLEDLFLQSTISSKLFREQFNCSNLFNVENADMEGTPLFMTGK